MQEETQFVNEVRQELKEEKILGLIKKVLPYAAMIGALALIIALGFIWYESKEEDRVLQAGSKYLELELYKNYNNPGAVIKTAKDIIQTSQENGDTNYTALSLLLLASESANNGNLLGATSNLEKVMQGNYDAIYKEMAKLTWCELKIQDDTVNPQQILAYLNEIIESDSAFANNAKEIKLLILKKYGSNDIKHYAKEMLADNTISSAQKVRVATFYLNNVRQ